jgi:hypothetical protein
VFHAARGVAWPGDGSPPAAAAPVAPSGGGLFVAAFVRRDATAGGGAAQAHDVCLALVRASRANPASTPGAATWAPLSAAGALLGGDGGATPPEAFAFDAARVAASAAACAETQRVAAQRLVVVEWLTSLGVPFSDTRPVGESSDEKSGLDSGFVRPTIAFHAGENAARGEGPARVEIALGGDAGVELTVRFPPGVPWSEARGLA